MGNGIDDGNGSNGYGDEGGGQAMATMALETRTGNKMHYGNNNKVVVDKEGYGESGKSNDNGNKEGHGIGGKGNGNGDKDGKGDGQRGQWQQQNQQLLQRQRGQG
jgi:hypothetical protein